MRDEIDRVSEKRRMEQDKDRTEDCGALVYFISVNRNSKGKCSVTAHLYIDSYRVTLLVLLKEKKKGNKNVLEPVLKQILGFIIALKREN